MNPRRTPFLRLLLPWAAGILAGVALAEPVPGLGYGLFAGLLGLLLLVRRRYAYRYRWVFGSLLLVLLFSAGYWYALHYDEREQDAHISRQSPKPAVFTGMVYDAPSIGAKLKVPLRLEAAGPSVDSLQPCTGNVLLFFEPGPESEQLRYGDRLWVQALIRPTEGPKNPQAFDYQRYLHFQNIHYQAFVKDRSYGVIATGSGHPLWRMAFRWREQLLALLREYFPGRDEYAVAAALLVGYKDDLSDELRTSYAETGSMHALAVSGTHVGLLYAGLIFLLRRIPWRGAGRRWGETTLVLLGIWAFTLVTGATASVLRASVMFTFYLLSKAIRRQASVWNILGASAFGLLLLNPYLLFDAGFQLSYSAVAGMVFFYPMFQKITPPLPKWTEEGWNILLIGVAAQLGTLPLSLYYFHQFPVYFWLAGWVVVLGGAVFLWGGSLLVFVTAIAPAPAAWLGWLLYQLVWGMNQLIRLIQQLPGSVVSGIWLGAGAAVLLGLFIWLFALSVMQRKAQWLLAALVLLSGLSLYRLMARYGHSQQRKITLYHVNRHFLLDFFDGERGYIWTDSLSERQERFAAQAHRWSCGIRKQVRLQPSFQAPFRDNNLFVRPPFVQFFGRTIAIPESQDLSSARSDTSYPVDILILRDNPRVQLSDCLRRFPCSLVVFDASNSRYRVERWKKECQASGITFYDVQESGAWEFLIQ